ncbi:MAG TPA: 50S ribosomal protein L10 [Solirubrobacteraceae bacterium]|nr:50S ribosomal protein L10 [Solirubrobacteraceae bacterium]
MNRDQKAAAIAEIAEHIRESQAVFAVDYQGISVSQAAELRAKLRESDATFKIVKNSLTERAADEVEAQELKALLQGPTALTFVRGDAATAAKALADYGRATQLLPFKGGLMDGAALNPDQIRSISKLPSREALYGQLVGVVASPVSGLVRTLGALIGGLAVALGQVNEKKQSGEIPAGEAPAAQAPSEEQAELAAEETTAAVQEPAAERVSAAEEPAAEETSETNEQESAIEETKASVEEPATEETSDAAEQEPAADAGSTDDETSGAQAPEAQAEPAQDEPAPEKNVDDQAEVSAETQQEDAEAKSDPKED